jgi:hypothetical protein
VSAYGCTDLEDCAAELALGTLPGDERAKALAHLDRCPDCRVIVGEYADVIDAVVDASPWARPPRSFGRRVVGTLTPRRRRPSRAVMVVVGSLLVLGLILAVQQPDRSRFVPEAVGGTAVGSPGVRLARLVPTGSEKLTGVVFLRAGPPTSVVMALTGDGEAGDYHCELVLDHGQTVPAGLIAVRDGVATWRTSLAPGSPRVTGLNVLEGDAIVARATFT